MMRSLFSGVSGLKVHQTKMDVIGNNIANVNTSGFKASNASFSDIFYQTTQAATGPNAQTGAAGQNAMQIGLGTNLASIKANITTQGGAQRTDNPLDVMINGDSFFIVNNGGTNYFTKSGSFDVDAGGTLCTASGATVMGWQVDANGNILKTQVSALKVMSPENQYAEPELTTKGIIKGNISNTDSDLLSDGGLAVQVGFYDNLGNYYNAKFSIKAANETDMKAGKYSVELTDIVDSNNKSIFYTKDPTTGNNVAVAGTSVTFGGLTYTYNATDNKIQSTGTPANILKFNPSTGEFDYAGPATPPAAGAAKPDSMNLKITTTNGEFNPPGVAPASYNGIEIGMGTLTQFGGKGDTKSSVTGLKGDKDGKGAGLPVGNMTGLKVDSSGKIFGTYNNGTEKLLGQIAVTSFSNPSGLEAVGSNMFAQTQNSGEFDGIGQDVTADGGKFTTGVLEMSNVDLSNEFTQMITTQRGFQANSRIITTSDTLLEELINLKR